MSKFWWMVKVLATVMPVVLFADLVIYPLGAACGYAVWALTQCRESFGRGYQYGGKELEFPEEKTDLKRVGGLL